MLDEEVIVGPLLETGVEAFVVPITYTLQTLQLLALLATFQVV